MKTRLPFVPTVIIALATVALIFGCGFWLEETFNLPDWVISILSMVALYSFYEVASRLGPKEFNTPISEFLKLSARDRVVLLIAILVFLIAALLVGSYFALRLLKFVFFLTGAFMAWLICFLFGSKNLKEQLVLGHKDSTRQQEK